MPKSKDYSQRLKDALYEDCENARDECSFVSKETYLAARNRIHTASGVNALILIGLNEYAWDMEYIGLIRWS